ncbi:hypothetical protein J45TS6_36090 [Paenibacillus sp. J45TS6]|uniref:Uncharacterized protein n=1 Tax=Paenibacillus gallinarum TaxID=2762232 RepID=A0ABR8T3X1_9BACL|nr:MULTISPECIES: hypothetical protein [Paenibacillus]MBD7970477.1 hypothetical protein [Paenibacillus gallinarum]GIP45150.1 hypothetical protein J45TS6_36090 [Paenibacillus sp. J45TS6]
MYYQYYEIVGSEKPIYLAKPAGYLTYEEIPNEDLLTYEEIAYLEKIENGVKLYEPLYLKEGE